MPVNVTVLLFGIWILLLCAGVIITQKKSLVNSERGNLEPTFNLPNASSIVTGVNTNVPCKGNGIGLGITEGTHLAGVRNTTGGLAATQNAYGTDIGTSTGTTSNLTITKTVGLTTDATKSGIVGTVTRSVLSINFAIKY